MGKTLIICEKPSLARNVVAAIEPHPARVTVSETDRLYYYESEKYVVAAALGHLLSLYDAEDYNEEYGKWKEDDLPIVPKEFRYKLKGDNIKPTAKLLRDLVNRPDVDRVVNAGDSDREGEIIIRNVLDYAGNRKPVYRLWMPDQTPKTISAQLADMKTDAEYDNLANEGYARTYIDWLYGINLTRLATTKAGKLLRVGRVTTPIVSAIYLREKAIREFVPEIYYTAVHIGDGVKLTSQVKCKTMAEAEELAFRYNLLPLTVAEKETKRKVIDRPKLFSLSDLQDVAGKKYRLAPKDTLDIVQVLYEAGYVTYPRTNSNYMAENEKEKAQDIITAVKRAFGLDYDGIAFRDSKEIFDDSKIEAHSAITPTYKILMPGSLEDPRQEDIYALILNRFAAAFTEEDMVVNKTTMVIKNDEEEFTLNGEVVLYKGWSEFEPRKNADELPNLRKGALLRPSFQAEQKETQPPKHYTVGTLNEYLKHPYNKTEKNDLSETVEKSVLDGVELGTEATRAGLIDNAVKSGYITLTKNRYGITELGEHYCQTLEHLGVDMTKERTLNLSIALKQIYRGESERDAVVKEATEDLSSIVRTGKSIQTVRRIEREPICKCPRCGKNIVENKFAYSCSDRECGTAIFKDDKFFARFQVKVTEGLAKALLSEGKAHVKNMISAKTGKPFSATVLVEWKPESRYPNYSLSFDNDKS